jgi:hypothetical protein
MRMTSLIGQWIEGGRSLVSPPPVVVNIHRLDTDNLGDRVSSPTLYFDFLNAVRRYDLLRVPTRVSRGARVVVFGGGGLLDNEYFRRGWDSVLAGSTAELIAWGLGHNRRGDGGYHYPSFLQRFSLAGLRDCDPRPHRAFDWVPCVSCMHEEFGTPHEVTTDIVCYEHSSHPLRVDGFPTMKNTERDFATAIRFLASAETVLTNTYHGMYWATLLGRKVIVFPFSSKFHGFKYPVALATPENWESARSRATGSPEALAECRAANVRFADKVRAKTATFFN